MGAGLGVGVVAGTALGVGAMVAAAVGARVGRAVGTTVELQAARPIATIAVPMMVVNFMSVFTRSTGTRHPRLHPRKCVEAPPSGDRSRSAGLWASAPVLPPHIGMHPARTPPASISYRLSEVNRDHYKDVVVASVQPSIRAGQTTHQSARIGRPWEAGYR